MSSRTRASSPGGQLHYARLIWNMLQGPVSANRFNIVADTLYLIPLQITVTATIDRLGFVANTPAGNIRMGVYADNGDLPDGGALLVESGPQAVVGFSKNELAIVATQLAPGLYWIAIISDGTPEMLQVCGQAGSGGSWTGRRVAQAFGALPNPCPVTVLETDPPIGYVRVASVP